MLVEEVSFSVSKNVHFWEKTFQRSCERSPLEGCILLEEECLFPLPKQHFAVFRPFQVSGLPRGKKVGGSFPPLLNRSDSSVVERLSYKQLVGGSNPSPVILLLFLGKTIPER